MSQSASKTGSKRAKTENGEAKAVERTKEDAAKAEADEAKADEGEAKTAKGGKRKAAAGASKKGKGEKKEATPPTRRSARGAAKAEKAEEEEKPKKSAAKAKGKGKKAKEENGDAEDKKEEDATTKVDESDDKEEKKGKKAPAKSKAKAKSKSKKGGKGKSKEADGEGESEVKEEKKSRDAERDEEMENYPQIDLSTFLGQKPKDKAKWKKDCKKIAELLHKYGFLIVKDPRVKMENNETFIDTLERYYGQPEELKRPDVRRELHYQVGITPEKTERAREHCERIKKLDPEEQPLTECPPELDNKLRFFWRIGERPTETEFKQLNAEPVIPKAFPEWPKVMNTWGELIVNTVHTVAEMAAEGFDMPRDTFTNMMKFGPHLLAPTGSDLNKYGALGTKLASYHYDLNFLTIHGRSRFPGLFIWTREGKKLPVKVPEGCLLLQAGKQFEWLTGGYVLAGFHEVVVVQRTKDAIERARAAGKSLWRVSSTLFGHIASDQTLEPLGKFKDGADSSKYPPTKAGRQVQNELNAIKLGQEEIAMGVVAAQ